MTDDVNGPHEMVERVANALRTPVHPNDDFESRVMSKVRREDVGDGGWWTRPLTLRITRVNALVSAMAFAAIVLAAQAGLKRFVVAPGAASARSADTVVLVRFVITDKAAQNVALVGSFNQWSREATPLRALGVPGTWVVDVPLQKGRHEYAFVASDAAGQRWLTDPFALASHDEFGVESSIVVLGPEGLD